MEAPKPDDFGSDEDFRRRYFEHFAKHDRSDDLERYHTLATRLWIVLTAVGFVGGALVWSLTANALAAQIVFWPFVALGMIVLMTIRRGWGGGPG